MAKSKDKKIYILTIEHIEGDDRCEYVKEEIVTKSDNETSWKYGEIDLKDYFSDSDLAGLTCCTIGKT
jgi:hypothetical protein